VDLTALHLKGPAEVWFNSYILGRRNVMWEEFIVDVCSRFRDDLGSKVVEDYNTQGQWKHIRPDLKSSKLSHW